MRTTVKQGWVLLGLLCALVQGSSNRHRSILRAANGRFSVVWNIPTHSCKNFGVNVDVKKYGIKENTVNGWAGPTITIFYADQMGLYPELQSDGTLINGGIPQKVNLNDHIKKCEVDINSTIPDANFSGLAVIDYEGWRPLWERNWDAKSIYKNLSESLVRAQHPDWSSDRVTEEAKQQFEQAARLFLTATLETAKRLRPHGQWGYYLFPECYNYAGQRKCDRSTRLDNNKLLWLFNTSTALYPSAYLENSRSPKINTDFVYGQIHEASRLRKKLSDRFKPIHLYSRIRYPTNHNWYTQVDLNSTIKQAHDLRINGVVLWDDNLLHENATICRSTQHYVDYVLGPFVRELLNMKRLPRHGIVWDNTHRMSKPFKKRQKCRTDRCVQHREYRNP